MPTEFLSTAQSHTSEQREVLGRGADPEAIHNLRLILRMCYKNHVSSVNVT